ncbi:uncharacterized protein NMK_1970 [Novimethylophilus kurashikiensis]|uniref:Uncharacterized protein n=1 Tax=Novimethylophilus kurashikiensis TaxID=1825523 RepID=A0A2R5FCD9_9PROT|nr:hypothetical protein [Novimethylophilus kurashikiensis]GBG14371.1 uncharacterized protein NMK_1970 [Novimethylophilus kurashikiensis]
MLTIQPRQSPSWRVRVARALLAMTTHTIELRELAYLLAGLGVVFRAVPPLSSRGGANSPVLAGAVLILVFGLLLAGPVLNAAQPIFRAMGVLPGWVLSTLVIGLLLWKLRSMGRNYLSALRLSI